MEHRISMFKKKGRGLEQQLLDAEKIVGALKVQVAGRGGEGAAETEGEVERRREV